MEQGYLISKTPAASHIIYLEEEIEMVIPGYVEVKDNINEIQLHSLLNDTMIRLTDPKYVDDFRQIWKGEDVNNIELVNGLKDSDMLIDSNRFKVITNDIRAYMEKHLVLTILPTEACNFRCKYCYEKHDDIRISEAVMDEVIEYIRDKAAELKNISVNWFGGEPTLMPELIIKYSGLIKRIAEENGIVFKASMTTNGYLLTVDMFKRFYDVGINNYQITLDGFEHDEKRVLVNGAPTLKKILGNLRAIKLLSSEYKFIIILRRNILKNEDLEWYDFLADGFAEDIRFRINIRKVSDLGGDEVKKLELIKEDDVDVMERHVKYASRHFKILDETITERPFSKMCYAAYPKGFVICADGTIEKCTAILHDKRNVVGRVIPGNGVYINEDKNRIWSTVDIKEHCMSCKSALSCNNLDCPGKSIFGDGLRCDNA